VGDSRALRAWPARLFWTAFVAWHAHGDARLPFQPIDRIMARQRRRMRAMVRHAYRTVPHYREAMDHAHLGPEDFRDASDLARLPLISGAELAEAPERFASSGYGDDRTLALHSSGTTGRPKVVRHSAASLFLALAHGQRHRAVMTQILGRRHGYREMLAARPNSVAVQIRQFYESRAWFPRRLELERAMLPLDAPLNEAVAAINAFEPDVLFGYGSHLGSLYRLAVERGLAIHRPKLIWYGADPMSDAERDFLERTLSIPVFSTYQADEALRLGFYCERRQGFHLCLDAVAMRVVDGEGRAVGPGETGELIISNLTNRATVLLNYRQGDLVTLSARPCPCGRSLPTIDRIEGRADDSLLLTDGDRRHPLAVLHLLQAVPGVVRLQLVQETMKTFVLRVVCTAGTEWPPTAAALDMVLRRQLGADITLEILPVDIIVPEPGGKLRAVISRCLSRS